MLTDLNQACFIIFRKLLEWIVSVQHCSTQFLWYRGCQFIGGTNGIWEINQKYVIYKAY